LLTACVGWRCKHSCALLACGACAGILDADNVFPGIATARSWILAGSIGQSSSLVATGGLHIGIRGG